MLWAEHVRAIQANVVMRYLSPSPPRPRPFCCHRVFVWSGADAQATRVRAFWLLGGFKNANSDHATEISARCKLTKAFESSFRMLCL